MNTVSGKNAVAAAVVMSLLGGCAWWDSHMRGHSSGASSSSSTGYSSTASSSASSAGGERLMLTGRNEVPPNPSNATGTATVKVASDCSVTVNANVTGMAPTAAHIHTGAPGANGPVAVPLTKSGENTFTSTPGAKLNDTQCAAYKNGEAYVNVHSANYPNGELRGQLTGRG
jgi:hypothetical protein